MHETQNTEYKSAWRDEYLKWLCGFANAQGGTLFIGKDDNGNVVGVQNAKKLLEDIPNKIKDILGIVADINLHETTQGNFLEIAVEPQMNAVSYKGIYFYRSGATNQELKGAELQQLILKSYNMTWDEITETRATIKDIDKFAVKLFVKQAIESNRLPHDTDSNNLKPLFHNLELTDEKGNLKRAAILLFGKQPTRFFNSAIFKIGKFRGNDASDLIIHDFIEGNIFQMPDKIMELLKSKYLLSPVSYKGLRRQETLEIPEKALREAIINAIIHRDYSNTASIEMRIFDKKIVLWNYGKLQSPLTIDILNKAHASYPRNSLIAKTFYRAGYVETWGRGTLTILNETAKAKLKKPVFEEFLDGFQITFERKIFDKNIENQFNDRQKKAIKFVQKNENINKYQYMNLNKCSNATAKRDLSELVEKQIFITEGNARSLIYRLIIGS